MKRAVVYLLSLSLVACVEDGSNLLGGRTTNNPGDVAPEALVCTQAPEGRSYAGFDGAKLEAQRTNENVGINRARQKPYAVLAGEYKRVLGVVPADLAASASSFDAPPARWFEEAEHSGVSLNAFFALSFDACKASPKPSSMPDAESAKTFCSGLMRKAWSRTPTPTEVDGCVELATKKLDAEPKAERRWAYVCASILSSSHFLTF